MVCNKALWSHRESPAWYIRLSFEHFPLIHKAVAAANIPSPWYGLSPPLSLDFTKFNSGWLTTLGFMTLWNQRTARALWFQVVWLALSGSLVLRWDLQLRWMDGYTTHSTFHQKWVVSAPHLWIYPDYSQISKTSEESLWSAWGKEQCFFTTLDKLTFSWKTF